MSETLNPISFSVPELWNISRTLHEGKKRLAPCEDENEVPSLHLTPKGGIFDPSGYDGKRVKEYIGVKMLFDLVF